MLKPSRERTRFALLLGRGGANLRLLRGSRLMRAVLASVVLSSCGDVMGPLSRAQLRELTAAEALWSQRGPAHYTIDMRRLCFCGNEVTEWATVEVRNNAVIAQTLLKGAPVPQSFWSSRPAISQLFIEIREMKASWLKEIRVTYDIATGYPTRVEYIENNNVADAGSVLEARNLIALTP